MQPGFEVRYLDIDWLAQGVPGKIDAAPAPLVPEPWCEGVCTVETTIFKNGHAWIGIRLARSADDAIPQLVRVSGETTPLLRITDPCDGGSWWVISDGWDAAKRRHVSELRRSAGDYRIRIASYELVVRNRLSGYGQPDVQAYVEDFRGNLLWMILNDGAGATAAGGAGGLGAELASALEEFYAAARRVLAAPALVVRESREPTPVSKVRATADTFRDYARRPRARHLTGRAFHESADTPENRYLRHLIALTVEWIDAWRTGASTQAHFLKALADAEAKRAEDSRGRTQRDVDPEMFDSQTAVIALRMKALREWTDGPPSPVSRVQSFPIRLTGRFGNENAFFYERIDGEQASDDREKSHYRVVELPDQIFDLVRTAFTDCPVFTFEGCARSSQETDRKGNPYLRLEFSTVCTVTPYSDPVPARAARRQRLERNGWKAALSEIEKKELRREANIAARRSARARSTHEELDDTLALLAATQTGLAELDRWLALLRVSRSDMLPRGMLSTTHPAYAGCRSSFKRVESLLQRMGFKPTLLENIGKIGILHASDLYEKWCLLKIATILADDFRFVPEPQWLEKLVRGALSGERNVEFVFARTDIDVRVVVTYQFETKTGYRPDFVIRVLDLHNGQSGTNVALASWLVLDAKFRSAWHPAELPTLLDELIGIKGYDFLGKRGGVFILQPCGYTLNPPASPLAWGSDCDYGARHSHDKGWVQAGVSRGNVAHSDHLKRLLEMALQRATPAPTLIKDGPDDERWLTRSICIGCGAAHGPDAVKVKSTKGRKWRWLLDCTECGTWTVRTHCYKCKASLFKNGTQWTYHETLADQVTNVICPECGSHFDGSIDQHGGE